MRTCAYVSVVDSLEVEVRQPEEQVTAPQCQPRHRIALTLHDHVLQATQ